MVMPTLTYTELRALEPCSESLARVAKLMGGTRKWDGKKINAKQARKAGATLDDIVWAASAVAVKNPDVERRIRLWLADCAAHVLHIYEKQINDERPRTAIIASRKFARGEIDPAAWDAARAAAGDARAAAGDAAWDAAWAARTAAWDAAGDAAWAAEQQWQFDRLILWLTKEPDDYPLPPPPKR